MFCFFKNYLSPKSFPENVICIVESAAEKFLCQKLANLLPTSEEVYTFKIFFKKMFTKKFSWIRRKQARQHFTKLPKVNFFSSKSTVFSLKNLIMAGNNTIHQTILWTHVMEFWQKCQNFFAKNLNFLAENPKTFDSKCKKIHETNQ